jgi:hypothetical protein
MTDPYESDKIMKEPLALTILKMCAIACLLTIVLVIAGYIRSRIAQPALLQQGKRIVNEIEVFHLSNHRFPDFLSELPDVPKDWRYYQSNSAADEFYFLYTSTGWLGMSINYCNTSNGTARPAGWYLEDDNGNIEAIK